ncbi:MAG: tetratricopeptide repeat protein [Gallionella sp.]|nr:tetratricopeptide repeat protein [Gallionella sp.]
MMERATLLHRSGKLEEARRLYMEIAQGAPDFAEAWHRLGLIAQAAGRLDEAEDFMRRAIRLDERQPLYSFGLGLVMQDKNQPGEAEKLFGQALVLNPNLAPAYNHLGVVLQGEQRVEEALHCFREAVRCHPGYARAFNNLGNLLKAGDELPEAINCFREAVRLSPDYRLALINLGKTLQESGDMAGAEESYRQAAKLDPDDFEAFSSLGAVQIMQVKLEQAEQAFKRALALRPDSVAQLNWLGYALREQGKMDESLAAYRRASELDTDNLQALLEGNLALPPIYSDRADVAASRRKYSEGLARLRDEAGRFKRLPAIPVLAQLQRSNFYLAYQGQNDRQLQSGYGDFVADVLSSVVPEFFEPIPQDKNVAKRRLRVGFLSSFLRECTVGYYFKSWITSLDRGRFEIFIYYTGHWRDTVTREIEASADHYVRLIGVEVAGIARRVKSDGLDVLIYPEMGMDVTGCMLGAMRLAPVQCVAWGHPVTTGHRNIDYYLSCASMEPENAREHYSEQLVLLGGIGTRYVKPAHSLHADRKQFSLPAERHLYLCPQSLFKIHPDNDEIFLDILEQDQKAALVFFQGMFATVTQAFMARLGRGMVARKLAVLKRVIFLPRMDHDAYSQVNCSCDVMLDTLHWSGGNTSLDALACALPMVTLPGEFMRGRQSYAMLKAMGLDELIARDKNDYVAIALRLGTDAAWRQEIRQRIKQNIGKIFENESPVKELEQFLLSRFAG